MTAGATSRILRWLGFGGAVPTRLSGDEALAIARTAGIDLPAGEAFRLAVSLEQRGKTVWRVSTVGRGRGYVVMIDDASGTILSAGASGRR